MANLVRPHGGASLRPLMLEGEALAAARERAGRLPVVQVSSREAGDIVMLGIGGFTPLAGFMGEADWRGVCDGMRTADGLFWPIPITLSVDAGTAGGIGTGDEIALAGPGDPAPVAILEVSEKYSIDKAHECRSVFRTTDAGHPGVKMVMEQGEVNLGGRLTVLSAGGFPDEFGELFLTPAETRARFEANGWSTVAAFQTRNPMHRSHEYLAKIAIEICDGVLIHSLLGNLKPGDVPASVRARAIDTLIESYFVANTVMHAGYPLDMRYAGPREALLHALFRQNYGCSHLLVGRDHAGSGRLLRAVRRPPHLRRDRCGVAGDEADPDRLDLLVRALRADGVDAHLPARAGGPAPALGDEAAQDALRGRRGAGHLQPPRGPRHPARVLRGPVGGGERQGGAEGALGRLRGACAVPAGRVLAEWPNPASHRAVNSA